MESLDLETSAHEWVLEHPELAKTLDRLGIDYCCAGKSLRYLCEQRDLAPENVLAELRQLTTAAPGK